MKKVFFTFIGYILSLQLTFADGGILGNIDEADIRNGNIHVDDIPQILRGSIDFFITIAGTIAVIFIIIGAYKILLGSLEQDKTKGKDTIIMAIGGFALASLAWFIVKLLIDNFGEGV
ncbi:pilin [Candidatus Gracilibacteria bacterium]|nr:pilin [Candidatus Gracilibacteria bacterium]